MIRIPFEQMQQVFVQVLTKRGMSDSDAQLCSYLIAETSLEGVYTHGANRFPALVRNIDEGYVDVHTHAEMVHRFGAIERWDGKRGVGNLNAYACMQRSIALSKEHGIGCVALANTTHWMRPGTYGLLAAEQDCIGILWTNTLPLMSAWGGVDAKLGNNPLVLAVPAQEGPVLVDAAMSLFSYGKLETYAREQKPLPVPGGYDSEGRLTTDAQSILETKRPLPIGFWKGTSLALALDLIAATLSGGRTTRSIGTLGKEGEVSQVFLAFDLSHFPDRDRLEQEIAASLADLRQSVLADPSIPVRFPGERRKEIRKENLARGIEVDPNVWNEILNLL
ncbi:3-dehydro-L-gulonate 2-dehydrogenase [Sphaerochaeta sp.]|uniref:3-dehydro-L-gulonate 2-dehydrogenase n=1 Tax=Sphaerochaeta sp. TaxID=1972642 RepID=UPI002FCAC108